MTEQIGFVVSSKDVFDVICALNPNLATKSYSDLADKFIIVNWPWAGRYSIMDQKEAATTFKTVGSLPYIHMINLKDRKLIKKEK